MASVQKKVSISTEVARKIASLGISLDEVLRRALNIDEQPPPKKRRRPGTPGGMLPNGTSLRAVYRGKRHTARVRAGAILLAGRKFKTVSAAAVYITGYPTNGWAFWNARLPKGGEFIKASEIRGPAPRA